MKTRLEKQLVVFCVFLFLIIVACVVLITLNERQVDQLIQERNEIQQDYHNLEQWFHDEVGYWPAKGAQPYWSDYTEPTPYLCCLPVEPTSPEEWGKR